jgi:hypothetical protein
MMIKGSKELDHGLTWLLLTLIGRYFFYIKLKVIRQSIAPLLFPFSCNWQQLCSRPVTTLFLNTLKPDQSDSHEIVSESSPGLYL